MRILTTVQMREADRATIEDIGIPALVLMENAGRQVVDAIETAFEDRLQGTVAVLCGRGNNGGDGFVAARVLDERGVDVRVFVIGALADVRGEARTNLDILGRLGLTVVEVGDAQAWSGRRSEVARSSLVIDALVGTGLRSGLTGVAEAVVSDVGAMGIPIVSIDLPSGLSADTPQPIGPCIDASLTVALAALKPPLVLPPGEPHAGDVVVADIGIPIDVIERVGGPRVYLTTREEVAGLVAPRPVDAHKGDFGRITVVAGSVGKTGAAALAAMAALRSGAGLVTVATPASCVPIVAAIAPEYMTEPLPDAAGTVAFGAADRALALAHDVIACGPGLGRTPAAADLVRAIVERAAVPIVLDADALAVLAETPALLRGRDDREVVITPHPGEMARLAGRTVAEVQADRTQVAVDVARRHHVHVVLKGHRTVIATPAGRVSINPTGNPGMATGGTGDVLTGAIAAWMAQIGDAEAACRLAVFLHGAAGDLAASSVGQAAMTATDVAGRLGEALRGLLEQGGRRPGGIGRQDL